MILSAIVASAKDGTIGKDGKMAWHLPSEAAYFRKTTLGHPIISGRKNFEAMGRPLPGRLNVIVTRQTDYKAPEGCVVVNSIDEALELEEVKNAEEVFIIGGQEIYDQAMPKIDKLYLTHVLADIKGDRFFKYNKSDWEQIYSEYHKADEKNIYDYEITILKRKH